MREIAAQIGLPNAKKKDSTGICFIGERPFREFLNRYLPTKPGPMKTPDGKTGRRAHRPRVLHVRPAQGHRHRRAAKDGSGEPWFVAGKDMATQYAVRRAGARSSVAARAHARRGQYELGRGRGARGRRVVRREDALPAGGRGVHASVRRADGRFALRFDDAQWAVTPGQSAVLYEGDVCLGGGIIEQAVTESSPVLANEAALLSAR